MAKQEWKRVAECIYRRGDTYQVRLKDPDTGRKATYGPRDGVVDRKSAFTVRDEMRAEARSSRRRARSGTTMAGYFDGWPDDLKRASSTKRHYREQVEPFLSLDAHDLDGREFVKGTAVGGLRFDQFTRKMARRFAADQKGRARAVSVFFSDAQSDGLTEMNPFHGLGLRRGEGGRKQLVVITRPELDLLERCAHDEHGDYGEHFAAMILTLAWTGVRPGELFVLRWPDIDFTNDWVFIRRAWRTKTREMVEYTKTGDQRKIVLPAPLRDPLRRLEAAHDASERDAADRDNLFATKQGSQFILQSFQYYWNPVRARFEDRVKDKDPARWRQLFEKADGRHKPMDPYELRHFCATYLLERGVPAHQVAVQLGHKDNGALVLSTYGHPSEDAAREVLRAAFGA